MSTEPGIELSREDELTRDFPLVCNRYRQIRDNVYTSARGAAKPSKQVLLHDEFAWLNVEDPRNVLARASDLTDRLYRLIAVACCRLVWTRLNNVHRRVVQLAENVAEGQFPLAGVENVLNSHRESLLSTNENIPWAFLYDGGSPTSMIDANDYYISRESNGGGVASFERAMAKEDMKEWRRMYADRAAYFSITTNPRVAASFTIRHVLATGLSKKAASEAINVLGRSEGKMDRHTAAQLCHILRDTLGNPYRQYPPIPLDLLRWNNGSILQMARHIYDKRDFQVMPILADMLEEADAEPVFVEHARHVGSHQRGCWLIDELLNKREA